MVKKSVLEVGTTRFQIPE